VPVGHPSSCGEGGDSGPLQAPGRPPVDVFGGRAGVAQLGGFEAGGDPAGVAGVGFGLDRPCSRARSAGGDCGTVRKARLRRIEFVGHHRRQ